MMTRDKTYEQKTSELLRTIKIQTIASDKF